MKMTFDRIKDDPCYGCKHASLKDIEKCDYFERLYLCHNRKRIDSMLDPLKKTALRINSDNSSLKAIRESALSIQSISGALVDILSEYRFKNEFTAEPYNGIVCPYKDLAEET